jgi:Bacterial Ig domain
MASRVRVLVPLGVLVALAAGVVGVAHSSSVPNAVTFAIADDAAQRAFPAELTSARSIGIGAARAYVGWADIATRRPVQPRNPADAAYDWTVTDADMARYGAARLPVWAAFWRTPAWASGSSDVAVWPANPKDLEDFAFAVAKRYPQVKVFMDWNEPNLKAYAKPNTIAAYEPMARAVYAGVKAASPSAEVIAGNLGRYRDNGRDPVLWAATLRADGVPMDAFGIHPYPDVAKPLSSRAPRYRIDLFDLPALARIAGVPVAVTEFGWSSMLAGAANQAAFTAQAIDVARCTPGLSEFVFWGYHDHPVPAGQTPDPWVTYGWLDATGAPKPVYDAGRSALAGTPDCLAVAQTAGAPAGWPDANTIPPTNYGPVCTDAALSSVAGASVSSDVQCTDPEGDSLGYLITTQPVHGTVSASGSVVTYTPTTGFTGSDTFTVTARDVVNTTPIIVSVSVTAPVTPTPDASASVSLTPPVTTLPDASVSGPVTDGADDDDRERSRPALAVPARTGRAQASSGTRVRPHRRRAVALPRAWPSTRPPASSSRARHAPPRTRRTAGDRGR